MTEISVLGAPALDVPRTLGRRLLPLQIGLGLQGFMLWVPVEKLFQTQIGFDAASIGVLAAAYSVVVPLIEVPSGILADRWSRSGLLSMASVALAGSSLVGGLSTNVATYIVAAVILGVYFAFGSGTVDSIVYDAVLEETGVSDSYERVIGRVRVVEAAALAASALAGGVIADWTSPRTTYFLTVPFALASIVAFTRFDEPRLHRAQEATSWREQVAATMHAMVGIPRVRRVLMLAALTALLSQAVYEFGPLWLVALHAPAAAFGPYWAALVSTTGVGGFLVGRLHLERPRRLALWAGLLAVPALVLALSGSILVVVVAQVALLLLNAVIGIHAGMLLHDAVPSSIRSGVSSGVGTLTWILFLPFSLGFGWLLRAHGMHPAAWALAGVAGLLGLLLIRSTRSGTPSIAREAGADDADEPPTPALAYQVGPYDVACRELVALVSDYVDGVLPAGWREAVDRHLAECDGCTAYLHQIRTTIDLLDRMTAEANREQTARSSAIAVSTA